MAAYLSIRSQASFSRCAIELLSYNPFSGLPNCFKLKLTMRSSVKDMSCFRPAGVKYDMGEMRRAYIS